MAYGGSQARGRIGAIAADLPTATAIATGDPSRIYDLHPSSQQRWILNPLSEARDQTLVLMDTSQVCQPLSHDRTPCFCFYNHIWFQQNRLLKQS